jgi:hypothetical protein
MDGVGDVKIFGAARESDDEVTMLSKNNEAFTFWKSTTDEPTQ